MPYALEKQVEFKERYYGYTHAVQYWRELQHATLPTFLRNYLPWVTDDTVVDTIQASGVVSLLGTLEPRTFSMPESKNRPLINYRRHLLPDPQYRHSTGVVTVAD